MQTSGRPPNLKSRGRTPTTVNGSPARVIFVPRTDRLPPKRRVQSAVLISATRSAPGFSSSGRKSLPRAGEKPIIGSSPAETRAACSCSGSPCPVRLKEVEKKASSRSKLGAFSFQSRYSG